MGGWRVGEWGGGGGAPELIEVLTFWWDGVKRVPADSQSAVRYCIQPASRSRALTPASHHSALFVSSFPPFFHSTQTPTHQLRTHAHTHTEKEPGIAAEHITQTQKNIHTNIFQRCASQVTRPQIAARSFGRKSQKPQKRAGSAAG